MLIALAVVGCIALFLLIVFVSFSVGKFHGSSTAKNVVDNTIKAVHDIFNTYSQRSDEALAMQVTENARKDIALATAYAKITELEHIVEDMKEFGEDPNDDEDVAEEEDDDTVSVTTTKASNHIFSSHKTAANTALELHDCIESTRKILEASKDTMPSVTFMMLNKALQFSEQEHDKG